MGFKMVVERDHETGMLVGEVVDICPMMKKIRRGEAEIAAGKGVSADDIRKELGL